MSTAVRSRPASVPLNVVASRAQRTGKMASEIAVHAKYSTALRRFDFMHGSWTYMSKWDWYGNASPAMYF